MKEQNKRMALVSIGIASLGMMSHVSASELIDVSQDQPTYFMNSNSGASAAPESAARAYLMNNASKLGLQSDLGNLVYEATVKTPVGFHVRFSQMQNGLPVDGASIVVTLNSLNQVLTFINDSIPSEKSQFISVSLFSLSEEQAIQIAYDTLKLSASPNIQTISKKVVIENGMARNVYQINLSAPIDKIWSWEILVDASSGQVVRSKTKAFDAHKKTTVSVTAAVFEPNPTLKSGKAYGTAPGYSVGNSAFYESMMTPVTLDNISKVGGKYSLVGPNVQLADFEAPTNPKCDSSKAEMKYKRDNPCFTDVSVYYFIDSSIKYLNGTLGFSAHPSYPGGVKVDPHGLNGEDNSHYDSQSDRLAFGDGGVPDGQDHDVATHELGHAIHNWLTHGHLSQVEGLSEGIGDYWASSYDRQFAKPGSVGYNWTFSYDGHNEFWPGRVNNISEKYPASVSGSSSEIHTAGQMWATVCMSVYDAIGKLKTDKIHWTAIAMLTESSSQLDAAKAFVVATRQLYPSEPETLASVLKKFQDHGYAVK